MEPETSKERFEKLIAYSGVSLASLTPLAGLELMFRFLDANSNRGRLSCSWGVVTQYGDDELGINITYWPENPSNSQRDDDPFDLSFKFGPHSIVGDFPEWDTWYEKFENRSDLLSILEFKPTWKALGQSAASGVALCFSASRFDWDLYDRWGVRDPRRPIVDMSREEWLRAEDVVLMLRWFRQEWRDEEKDLDRQLQRYFLACCRNIWRLLPHELSREGVEITERLIDGVASPDEFGKAEWAAESVAFMFDFDTEPETIARWIDEVSRISPEKLRAMLHDPRPEDDLSPRGLLQHVACFAHASMVYPTSIPRESIERYRIFLPAPLLRSTVGDPFRSSCGDRRDPG